jgi:hypothetical protein
MLGGIRAPGKHYDEVRAAAEVRYAYFFIARGFAREVADHEAGPLHASPQVNSRRAPDFRLDHVSTVLLILNRRSIDIHEPTVPGKGIPVLAPLHRTELRIGYVDHARWMRAGAASLRRANRYGDTD